MTSIKPLIDAWNEAHRELAIAINGTPDEDLWRRAHPRLLSVGELAGHVAYWEAVWTQGDGRSNPDLKEFELQSPLIDEAFRYYTDSVGEPVEREIGTASVLEELKKIHASARSISEVKELTDAYPGQWGTWGSFVQYQAFHAAYHAGQVYSVRHMLGHETEDN
jgi:hypothetical protein